MKLPANSVGARQIKAGAVRSSDVRNSSLLAEDLKAGQLPTATRGAQGPAGARGLPGPQGLGCPPADPACRGPQGTPGTNGLNGATNVVVRTGTASANPLVSIAKCIASERATGGGGAGGPILQSSPYISDGHAGDQPAGAGQIPTAWGVTLQSGSATSWVVCSSP